MTARPEITGCAIEPLGVSPRQACVLLSIGNTRLYQLINNGELESYSEGRARRITTASIRHRLARLLAASRPETQAMPRRRGRPRKQPAQGATT